MPNVPCCTLVRSTMLKSPWRRHVGRRVEESESLKKMGFPFRIDDGLASSGPWVTRNSSRRVDDVRAF